MGDKMMIEEQQRKYSESQRMAKLKKEMIKNDLINNYNSDINFHHKTKVDEKHQTLRIGQQMNQQALGEIQKEKQQVMQKKELEYYFTKPEQSPNKMMKFQNTINDFYKDNVLAKQNEKLMMEKERLTHEERQRKEVEELKEQRRQQNLK